MVDILLADGAQLNPADAGLTPLMRALERRDLYLMKFLLSRGADVNWKNRLGLTPLMAAVAEGSPDAVTLLIGAGAESVHVRLVRGGFAAGTVLPSASLMSVVWPSSTQLLCA